ncbi:hypothetical protein BESB_048970 [Besnoitia besnoiti]|uniref:Uncharacterized protein n=1 Tax=Besnoitia besnoiti TaxID=94643 RepID=A0A2A9MFD9_BESBE|nr:hypothetical protein BESB_048970 [Besnoitia besnoiti]PFH36705.1 hypothetical protein BESB_048970 [Besnoitia besnoiti]
MTNMAPSSSRGRVRCLDSRTGVFRSVAGLFLILAFGYCMPSPCGAAALPESTEAPAATMLDDILYQVAYPEDPVPLVKAVGKAAVARGAPHMVPVTSCEVSVIPLAAGLFEALTSPGVAREELSAAGERPLGYCQVHVTVAFDLGEKAEEDVERIGRLILQGRARPLLGGNGNADGEVNSSIRDLCKKTLHSLPIVRFCDDSARAGNLAARFYAFVFGEEPQGLPNRAHLELEGILSGEGPENVYLMIDSSSWKASEE